MGSCWTPLHRQDPQALPLRGGARNGRASVPSRRVLGREGSPVPTCDGQVQQLSGPAPLSGKRMPGEERGPAEFQGIEVAALRRRRGESQPPQDTLPDALAVEELEVSGAGVRARVECYRGVEEARVGQSVFVCYFSGALFLCSFFRFFLWGVGESDYDRSGTGYGYI